jgi:hypothetical protein
MASNQFQAFSFVATAANTTDAVPTEQVKTLAVQVVCATLSHADGTIKLQYSLDGTNWADVATATTLAAGASVVMLKVDVAHCSYYRAVYAKGSNATGTVSVKFFGRV